jgi:hypothetical protein
MYLMRLFAMLIGAAILEVGGDALVRMGLQKHAVPLLGGAACLVVYGVVVNLGGLDKLGGLDFGRLMGVYIVVFFIVSQIIAILVFGQLPGVRAAVAAALMITAAGVLLTQAPVHGPSSSTRVQSRPSVVPETGSSAVEPGNSGRH